MAKRTSRHGAHAGFHALPLPPTLADLNDIACQVPLDPVDQFVTRGRDAFGDDGVDDRRLSRELAHAGLAAQRWRP